MRAALVLLVACQSTADAPHPTTFKRDFSKDKSWKYAYRQDMQMTQFEGSMPAVTGLESAGTMTLTSNKDKTAKLDVVAKLTIKRPDSAPESQDAPPQTMTLTEDGYGADPQSSSMGKILFPIPKQAMKLGDTETMTITIPSQGLAGKAEVSAPMTLKLTAYRTIKNVECAEFTGEVRLDEKRDNDRITFDLDGKYYLDPKDASLVQSNVHIDLGVTEGPQQQQLKLGGTLTLDRQ